MITYYLFGQICSQQYKSKGINGVITASYQNRPYKIFKFVEGKTPSIELVKAFHGWNDYTIITENDYNILSKIVPTC